MNAEKYNRTISLQCPTCGGTDFETEKEQQSGTVQCAGCGLEITRDELLDGNSEQISAHVQEIGDEVVKDAADELKRSLKRAFRGNDFIKIS